MVRNLGEYLSHQLINFLSPKTCFCVSVKEAVNFRLRACYFSYRISVEQAHEHSVADNCETLLAYCALAYGVYGSRFVEGKKQQVYRYAFRLLNYRASRQGDGITLSIKLRIERIYSGDVVNIQRNPRQGCVADYLISNLKALVVSVVFIYFLHHTVKQPAGIRYGVVQLASLDDDILDLFFYGCLVVSGFLAYLPEACSLHVNTPQGHSHFAVFQLSAVVQFPRRCRKDLLWRYHSLESVCVHIKNLLNRNRFIFAYFL